MAMATKMSRLRRFGDRGGQIRQAAEQRPVVAHSATVGFRPAAKPAPAGAEEIPREWFSFAAPQLDRQRNCVPTARAVGYILFAAPRLECPPSSASR